MTLARTKSKKQWVFSSLALAFGILILLSYQNCGNVSLVKSSLSSASSTCSDFADSKPESIYEDASLDPHQALFKVNELTALGQLVTSQRIYDWSLDGQPQGSSRDFSLSLNSLTDCQVYEITASLKSCGEQLTWKKSYMKAGAHCSTTTTTTTSSTTTTTVPTSTACPAVPNAEQTLVVNDEPRTIFILRLPKGTHRYIKLQSGPWWIDKSRFDQMGIYGVNNIIPRISGGWHGVWAISRCPGDVTSANVIQSSSWDINMYWYGLPTGASPLPSAQNSGANGLPGLLTPESEGGQSWYINFRTDDCEQDRICQENPGTCDPLLPPMHNHWYGLDGHCQSSHNVF